MGRVCGVSKKSTLIFILGSWRELAFNKKAYSDGLFRFHVFGECAPTPTPTMIISKLKNLAVYRTCRSSCL